jgi:hypothetical protein
VEEELTLYNDNEAPILVWDRRLVVITSSGRTPLLESDLAEVDLVDG